MQTATSAVPASVFLERSADSGMPTQEKEKSKILRQVPRHSSSVCRTLLYLLSVLLLAPLTSHAQAKYPFDLPAQPLAESLRAVGHQTSTNVMFEPRLVKGLDAPALRTETTAAEAIRLLLAGTKLAVLQTAADTILIQRMSTSEKSLPTSQAVAPASPGSTNEFGRLAQAEGTASQSFAEQPEQSSQERMPLEQIVVTAQKRAQRLQEVPISISVMRGEDLDTSTGEGLADALNRVPGVAATLNVQGGGNQLTMRGVTASGPVFEGSSPVAYYLDSVPFGLVKSAIVPDSNAYDMERVEVLRGPQGTLYGASALNGVVRVLTKDADLDSFEVKTRLLGSATRYGGDNYRADGAVNVPLVDGKLAARVVAGYESSSGWIDRVGDKDANDSTVRNLRLKLNAQPTEQLSIGLSAWWSRSDYGAPSTSGDGLTSANTQPERMFANYDAYGLKIGYDMGAFSISSMTSYLNHENGGDLDLTTIFGFSDPTLLFTGFESKILSQEFLLNSAQSSAWRWTAGAFYRDGKDHLLQTASYMPANTDYSDTSKSIAVFGEIGRRFMDDKLEWTAGLRYFHDKVTNKENVQGQGLSGAPLYRAEDSFNSTTPRAILSWHPTEDLSVYSSYSQGFRSGFPQNAKIVRSAPGIPPLKPDKLRNYEVGAKGSWLDGRISFDSAVYFIDWNDVQQTLRVLVNGVPASAPVNGADASGYGVDFGLNTRPIAGLELGINMSWNNLQWDESRFFDADLLFKKGERLNYSPEYTLGASLDYVFPLGAMGLDGRFSGSANYTSKQLISDFSGGPRTLEMGGNILIARASIGVSSGDRWTASLFGDNLTNEDDPIIDVAYGVPDWSPRVRPRTIGLQFEYRFR